MGVLLSRSYEQYIARAFVFPAEVKGSCQAWLVSFRATVDSFGSLQSAIEDGETGEILVEKGEWHGLVVKTPPWFEYRSDGHFRV
jgi:hypothetical protein